MKTDLFKKTEKILYNYKKLSNEIESIDMQIIAISNDVSIAGVSYDIKTGKTNKFSSSVENDVVMREEHNAEIIERLKKKKEGIITLKKLVNIALNTLEPEEVKIIELRYFQKMSWIQIGMELIMDNNTCHKKRNTIVTDMIKFIFPMEANFSVNF